MDERTLLQNCEKLFEREPRLIRLQGGTIERVVFVGDTHGDLDASERVLERYLHPKTVIVFLGDYVDRGPHSRENLQLLLKTKLEHPDRVYLLQGNHEGFNVMPFYPADFWESLDPALRELYAETLAKLPYSVALSNGILGLHGALPAVKTLVDMNGIELGSEDWQAIVWGDWQDAEGTFLGDYGGRPQFGREHFQRQMERFGMRVLVRSHQPNAPLYLFDDRCLTIFTSHAYGPRERTVAIVPLGQEIQTSLDLVLEGV
jgi:predicted phosphodiesterase